MKKLFRPFLMVATVATVFAMSSCTKECDEGYEGTDCKTEVRAKMLGDYNATESKNGGANYSYSGSIVTSSADVTEVFINRMPNGTNFFNTNVKATVSGNTLTIANQEPDHDGYSISGSGEFNAGTPSTITFTYQVSGDNGSGTTVIDGYTATWTRQ